MKKIDIKSLIIGVLATITVATSINATNEWPGKEVVAAAMNSNEKIVLIYSDGSMSITCPPSELDLTLCF